MPQFLIILNASLVVLRSRITGLGDPSSGGPDQKCTTKQELDHGLERVGGTR